jgi:hypothetical protein
MAGLTLDSAEQGLIETIRDLDHDNLELTISRSSFDDWKIEMSFDDSHGRATRRRSSGIGSTFAEAWADLNRSGP